MTLSLMESRHRLDQTKDQHIGTITISGTLLFEMLKETEPGQWWRISKSPIPLDAILIAIAYDPIHGAWRIAFASDSLPVLGQFAEPVDSGYVEAERRFLEPVS